MGDRQLRNDEDHNKGKPSFEGITSLPVSDYDTGRGRLVVKVMDSGQACHEFEPTATEDQPCRRGDAG
ncbi:hypothetical protein TNCV_2951771 [Trichonephila clavipes]|nr:hypothetical protein TNCV_2951771 [Trichonephila clavipes]